MIKKKDTKMKIKWIIHLKCSFSPYQFASGHETVDTNFEQKTICWRKLADQTASVERDGQSCFG